MRNIIKRIKYILGLLWNSIKMYKTIYLIVVCTILIIISTFITIKSITAIDDMNKVKDELLYTQNKLCETQKIVIKLDDELDKIEHTNNELSKELKSKAYLENILKDLSYRWDRK